MAIEHRRLRLRHGVLVLAAVLAAGVVSPAGASTTIVPAPTERALEQAVATALTAKTLPKKLTPTLQQLSADKYLQEGAITYLRASCNPYSKPSEAADPTPCWYGSSSPSAPVIAIFGDSFVGNWMPALTSAATRLGYRVADFEFMGCFTAFVPSALQNGFNETQVKACDLWHKTLPAAVRRLHPAVIVAANGSWVWQVGQSAWVRGMQVAFKELNPTGSAVDILMGTGVHLNLAAPACLAAEPSNIQACSEHLTKSGPLEKGFARDALVASAVPHLHLITTYQWVCHDGDCPTIVSHIVLYADWDHLTIAYSEYLSKVFFSAFKAVLDRAHAEAPGGGAA